EVSVLHRRSVHEYGAEVGNLVGDRNDSESVRRALSGQRFDWVFDNVYDWEFGTTAEQVEATARACGDGIQRYVFMSSCAVYGEGLDLKEDSSLVPDNCSEIYAANKAASERALFRMHREEGFPAVTLRPPFVYGPENPFYREQFFWDRMRDDREIIVPGDGERLMHFVYVNDLAEACLLAATSAEAVGEAFNVGNRRPIGQLALVERLGAAAGIEPRTVLVPREEILAAGGEVIGENLYFGVYFDMPSIAEDVSKAERQLGLTPTAFERGLGEAYEWYLAGHQRPVIDYSFEDGLLAGRAGGAP
ncbi:MAG: NAD-dependent epimerase/dehydratase family protein, partial [Gemmatimonadetes bacterium]|nr:NAD-dependent epimerase/dehydratase family protein [Gemmatimonadota bacterium]